jgi:hypothetical protein
MGFVGLDDGEAREDPAVVATRIARTAPPSDEMIKEPGLSEHQRFEPPGDFIAERMASTPRP